MDPKKPVLVGVFILSAAVYLAVLGGGFYIAYLIIVALKKYIGA